MEFLLFEISLRYLLVVFKSQNLKKFSHKITGFFNYNTMCNYLKLEVKAGIWLQIIRTIRYQQHPAGIKLKKQEEYNSGT